MQVNQPDLIRSVINDFSRTGITPHTYPSPIGMWPNEIECLIWLASQAPEGDWIELGSFCGGSATVLCMTRRKLGLGKYVVSVDKDFDGLFDVNVYDHGRFQDISLKIEDISDNLPKHYNRRISFALIDGFHSFRQVLKDFETIKDMLVDGAILAFHDVSDKIESDEHLGNSYNFARSNFNTLISKQEEDFFLDEAVAFLINEYDLTQVKIPVKSNICIHSKETGLTEYVRSMTSPFNALTALKYVKR